MLRVSEEAFKLQVGEAYEEVMSQVKDQMMSITFDVQLEVDEEITYILDGDIKNEAFWKQIKQTAFNSEQYDIEHQPLEANLSVTAGAGTGKTKVMIDRIMFLKHMQPAMSLSEIAMITFTNESTMEMRTRLSKRLSCYYKNTQDTKYLRWMDELSNMYISTIHAFSMDVLKKIGNEIGIVNIQISSFKHEKKRLIEAAIDEYSKQYPEEYRSFRVVEQYKIVKLINEVINFLDNRAILLDEKDVNIEFGDSKNNYHHLFNFVIPYVAQHLQALKEASGKYEINDLIKMLHKLITIERIGHKIHFNYVMVDEFQDTDEVQIVFITWLIKQMKSTLFVVGDVKQSIYRFRGADYTAFKQLSEMDIPLVKKNISKNYRTDVKLMERLNKLFYNLGEDVDKFEFDQYSSLQAMKNSEEVEGMHIVPVQDMDSPFALVRDIYNQQIDKGSVCVLCRTNSEVNELVQAMETMSVPCIAEVKGNFFRHTAIRDFYLLVRCLLHEERTDEWVLLEQSVYGEGKLSPDRIMANYSADKNFVKQVLASSSWYETMSNMMKQAQMVPAIKVIREVIETRKPHVAYAKRYYKQLISNQSDKKDEMKQVAIHKALEYEANLNHLLFLLQKEFSDATMTLFRLEKYLKRKIATDNTEDMVHLEADEKLQALRVMTVHKAKGLEFNTVILPYTNKKFINYKRNQYMITKTEEGYEFGYSIYSQENGQNGMTSINTCYKKQADEEEKELVGDETRLFYVACTRAESELYLFKNLFAQKGNTINNWMDLIVRG